MIQLIKIELYYKAKNSSKIEFYIALLEVLMLQKSSQKLYNSVTDVFACNTPLPIIP